jgi:hypothetical protein
VQIDPVRKIMGQGFTAGIHGELIFGRSVREGNQKGVLY